MNSKTSHSQRHEAVSSGDVFKYVVASVLALAGLFFWFWFAAPERAVLLGSWAPQLRSLGVIVGLVAGAGVFMATVKGREVREFLAESRFELRKVVWPTRQEATRMMWIVVAVVIILSLVLGGFDFVIQKLVQWLLAR
ncbi:MAG: preprotein translocase subunit SecE [Xanthomonadaceae bacterium]|jgi:preprotein translocase subunit SecE|nr:preprotein translocase subunit SecE [Xanthomonadaceae bacterium]